MISAFRLLVILASASATGALAFDTAHADRAICATLRRQLASAPNGGVPTDDRAAQMQALQLQHMRAKASEAGCNGFLVSRSDPAACMRYAQTIDGMSTKLGQLRRMNVRSQAPSRQQILASLDINGCNRAQVAAREDSVAGPRRTIFEFFFGMDTRYTAPGTADRIQPSARMPSAETFPTSYEGTDPGENVTVKKGRYRTLCVRTCDGYYFPISFSSQPSDFPRDQYACTAMCPTGKAQLYYHGVPEQESDDMISVADQKPYSELPNAFNYRTLGLRAVPGCACHAQPDLLFGSVRSKAQMQPASAPAETTSSQEPEQDEGDISEPNIDREYVRVVGPAFFPDLTTPQPAERKADILTPENIVRTITSDILRRIQ